MIASAARRLSDDAGLTLTELIIAMFISTIVLLALLGTFDSFSSNAARQTKVTDANDTIRSLMDRVVSDLRQARAIEVADANDLVYAVVDSPTKARRVRICLDASSRLWRSNVTTSTPPAVPIASGTTCPTAGTGAAQITTLTSANSAAEPLFRYDTATAANVRSVGLTFALVASTRDGRVSTSTLRASTFVRAQSETALATGGDDISVSCSSAGVPTLTLASSIGPLSVQYTDLNGTVIGSTTSGTGLVLPATATTVVANISVAGGAITQVLKTIAC